MKKAVFFLAILYSTLVSAQVDYSSSWEDFFSYNNVKDFEKIGETIYALSDNGVFIYNTTTQETQKLSSVQGLSGETTSAIHYNESFNRLVIGYENGLIEVVDQDGSISISADIVNFNQSGEKRINHISEFNDKLYLSTPFAVVVYDIDRLEFGDTYFIGNNSTAVKINETIVFNDVIYAATENGIYRADVSNPNLIDFNNWELRFPGNYTHISAFNNRLFSVRGNDIYEINGAAINVVRSFLEPIIGFKVSSSNIAVSLSTSASFLDVGLNQVLQVTANAPFEYNLNNALAVDNTFFLATKEFGILSAAFSNATNLTEIHPEGPITNDVFSIQAQENHLWVVYGGYTPTFAPTNERKGFSHYNGENWTTVNYSDTQPFPDMVDITIDPTNPEKVFISCFNETQNVDDIRTAGLITVENDAVTNFYNHINSGLEDLRATNPTATSVRVSSSAFDRQGNLWMTNIDTPQELKKFSSGGAWSGFDISSIKEVDAFGLTEVAIDRNNSVWIGSRRDGALVFNENGNRMRALTTQATRGSLPNANVRTIAVDRNNRIWIGTLSGLVIFNNASGLFDADVYDANPIIILDDGIPRRLLGDQTVNSIVVDGADNKWLGTDNGGVIYTNPNGQTTLANFSTQNSPLPSNKIIKITVDDSTGKVFFATDKGVVAYKSNVAPFGDTLGDVYAYPNPALKNHATVTIDGRNGTHLPKGTNVKILDVAGHLVYETNVVEGQELQGGKVVWNKTNLAGKKVASGIYIVLLSNDDATETSFTKIAIVN
ncbi:two-component regulator propeller domain-containing protein [Flavobacteriaceae bacterium S356]|uniref:Two-component regulator propeller domain-containing protein n=1 Tax=Asprobacillus argus TaxID=3076534 RepID=A0ABU3LBN3_9FLAO|nr:two-component regulator propeller domain-containing protein [Flavobacteriaceae bacterium S356]